MKKAIFYVGAVLLFFFTLYQYESIPIAEQSDTITCGLYADDLTTFSKITLKDDGEMQGNIKNDTFLIKIKRVYTEMCRDHGKFPRYRIEVNFNDRTIFQVSHTDIPFAVNLFYKNTKYRVICVD